MPSLAGWAPDLGLPPVTFENTDVLTDIQISCGIELPYLPWPPPAVVSQLGNTGCRNSSQMSGSLRCDRSWQINRAYLFC
jgi:hypothetical protein